MASTASTDVDRRCLNDGAYSTHGKRELFRCLGARLPRIPSDRVRVGFENAHDPSDVRWIVPHSIFAQRLRFVAQGEPTTDRETVEAMR